MYYGRNSDGSPVLTGGGPPILATALPATHLVNLAREDHDHCAVKYASNKPPVEVAQVPLKFRDIADVVSHEIKSVLKDCDLIDSHACSFGKAKFTHVILKDGDKMVSVLVTDAGSDDKDVNDKILSFASDKYAISQFDYDKRAIFVVSEFDAKTNAKAAKALYLPIRKHLDATLRPGSQTAFLLAR